MEKQQQNKVIVTPIVGNEAGASLPVKGGQMGSQISGQIGGQMSSSMVTQWVAQWVAQSI